MSEFTTKFNTLLMDMRYRSVHVPMNHWQSQRTSEKEGMTYSLELQHVNFQMKVAQSIEDLQDQVKPNLPWAEDHFLERVSGQPLNPPPSEAWWPFAVAGNAEHKEGKKFSHTYPERIWPKLAEAESRGINGAVQPEIFGIRYEYGDLEDVINLLAHDPYTRQAYLPIWFPEDTGAVEGQRVPCTLGYHFLLRPGEEGLHADIVYHIRSCDLFRHFTDDVYMAARLLQWVVGSVRDRGIDVRARSLIMQISSLHVFEGDTARLKYLTDKIFEEEEPQYGSAV